MKTFAINCLYRNDCCVDHKLKSLNGNIDLLGWWSESNKQNGLERNNKQQEKDKKLKQSKMK